MKKSDELRQIVQEKYGEIAEKSFGGNQTSCCGPAASACCGTDTDYTVFSEDYTNLEGYNPDADLGLGCGLPTEFAKISEGDTVVDLGSGAGNDCFVARSITGPNGKVIGVDMTPKMIEKARANAEKLGLTNVEFRLGEIEHLPVADGTADVVISNCVLNLVPEKEQALQETFRILKPGGHFSISDIVTYESIPESLREEASLYAGCVSGAMIRDEYIQQIREAGFVNITVQKERKIDLPLELLNNHLSTEEVARFGRDFSGIASVTIYAEKPVKSAGKTCC